MKTRKIHKPPAAKVQIKPKKISADPKPKDVPRSYARPITGLLPKPTKHSKPGAGHRALGRRLKMSGGTV